MWVRLGGLLFLFVCLFMPPAMGEQAGRTTPSAEMMRLYKAGKFAKAIPVAKQILRTRERVLGPDHPNVATILNFLGLLYELQGEYQLAEPFYKRGLTIREKVVGTDHPEFATDLHNLGALYHAQGRHEKAEDLMKRSLTIREGKLGRDHAQVAQSLNDLANLYQSQARYEEAEGLLKRSLKIFEIRNGPDHLSVGSVLNNLVAIYYQQARYGEAEPLMKRSLRIIELRRGPDHPNVGSALNSLSSIYSEQGRFAEAEPLMKRSLKIREKILGPDHLDVANSLNSLATLYHTQRRYKEAEPLMKRSLAIREAALGSEHPKVGRALNNLAEVYRAMDRYAETEPLYRRSLKIYETSFGPDHPALGVSVSNLARLYFNQKRYGEAKHLMMRSLRIYKGAFGPNHPSVARILSDLALLALRQKQWDKAALNWRSATEVLVRRARRNGIIRQKLSGKRKSELAQNDGFFRGFVKAVYRDETTNKDANERGKAMFSTAQWALGSDAAGALAQMSARGAAEDLELGKLIRERQDLLNEWQKRDQARSQFASLHPNKRDKKREMENTARLDEIDRRFGVIDNRLNKDFPDYAAIANPVPLSVQQTQDLLQSDEALVLFLDTRAWKPTPEETFIWVVTKDEVTWVRSPLGADSLSNIVKRLRCGLDIAGWQKTGEQSAPCKTLTARGFDVLSYYKGKASLPFEPEVANVLYEGLFGQIKDKIKGRKLLLVPSGALTSLPFQVLLSETPAKGTQFQNMAWLIKDHDLTVLPSVASLKALRRNAKASNAKNAYIGFGNPLLVGRDGKDKSAWAKQACVFNQKARPLRIAGLTIPDAISKYFRGGAVDIGLLKRQAPLPETADELCQVAKTLGATEEAVFLGDRAREADVKRLSEAGQLKQAKILHFATHGLLADETSQLLDNRAEPSLILTPPEQATERDDGLLTASEITQLKLDADWVILSACNTASGDKPGAAPMSGLAKAFFYAGARALLISHWSVNSDATVALITKSFQAQQRIAEIGRAGALRIAMLELIKSKGLSHPEYWAPFIVVGEGN